MNTFSFLSLLLHAWHTCSINWIKLNYFTTYTSHGRRNRQSGCSGMDNMIGLYRLICIDTLQYAICMSKSMNYLCFPSSSIINIWTIQLEMPRNWRNGIWPIKLDDNFRSEAGNFKQEQTIRSLSITELVRNLLELPSRGMSKKKIISFCCFREKSQKINKMYFNLLANGWNLHLFSNVVSR